MADIFTDVGITLNISQWHTVHKKMSALLHTISWFTVHKTAHSISWLLYTRQRTQSADYCTQDSALNKLICCTQDSALNQLITVHKIAHSISWLLYTRQRTQSADYCTQDSALNQLIYCTQDGAPEAAGTRGCARNTRGSKQVTNNQVK